MTHIELNSVAEAEQRERQDVRKRGPFGFFYRLHLVAGILVAPLLLVAALTGIAYAFAPTVEEVLYREVVTATSENPPQPVAAQIAAAQQVHPDLDFSAVQISEDRGTTTRVLFTDESLKSDSYRQAVFVDPGDLTITGDMPQYGSSRALPFRAWVSEGHRRLWLGDAGRIYSELAASWLGAISLAGLVLWWRGRKRSQSALGKLKRQHSTLGVWLLPGFLFFTVTGLTWSLLAGTNIGQIRQEMDWMDPKPAVTLSASTGAEPDTQEIDRVISAAREAGLTGMIDVNYPKPDAAWVVKESRQAHKWSNDSVSVDGQTGAIVDTVSYSEWPLAAKLTNWLIQLHMGTMFGIANQLILATIAVGLIATIVLAYRMWFVRGRSGTPGRLPRSAGWQTMSLSAKATVIVAVIVYSAIAPMFGISLLAFVLIDAIVQFAQRRRTAAYSGKI